MPAETCTTILNPSLRSPIIADLHTHTRHSHGQNSVEEMYAAARSRGIKILGFSEHSPRPAGYTYVDDYQESLRRTFPTYVREVQLQSSKAGAQGMKVLLGLEVDYIAGHEEYAAELCREYPYDYIIGGLHYQGNWGFDGPATDWDPLTREQKFACYDRYYIDLEAMCRTGLFAIAAHPDLIKIHSVETFREWLQLPEAMERVRTTLAAMKEYGVAMEVSSAGLRKPCKEIYPGPVLMKIASDLDLPISFGSDAHCVNTPAYAFKELASYAASFGYFTSIVVEQGKQRALPFTSDL